MRFYLALDQRFFLPRCDLVICVSGDLRERCITFGVPAKRCVVIENGIDTEHFTRRLTVSEAKRRLGFTEGRFLIGAVGRLAPEKAFDLLIRAVGKLVAASHDIELAIAGEGPERERLQALVDCLGLEDRVSLLGHRSDMVALYQAMDVYALSSLTEGLPNVLLEAMALETPIVATRVGGVPRLIEDGVDGLMVEPRSVDALVVALDRLLRDPELRGSLALAGRATIEARYSFTHRMQKMKVVYDDLLRETTRTSAAANAGRIAAGAPVSRDGLRETAAEASETP
jgi:glycosyltransferase involved in cell wall biosynthesis